MKKSKEEWAADERRYLATIAAAQKRGSAPAGAAIIRLGIKGVVGVKTKEPEAGKK